MSLKKSSIEFYNSYILEKLKAASIITITAVN